jgi:hypothetical protein
MTSAVAQASTPLVTDDRIQALQDRVLPPDVRRVAAVCSNREDVSALIQQMSMHRSTIGLAVLPVADRSGVARLVSWVGLVRRTRSVESMLRRAGLRVNARLGVFPNIDAPRIIFELDGAAGRYAEAELMPEPVHGPVAAINRMLRRLGGMSTSIGAVVIVAAKS